jgi:hypothetical protein
MARPNPHGGEKKIGNYSTGTKYASAAQLRNQAKSNRYPLNNYEADFRFKNSGAFGLGKKQTRPFQFPGGGGGGGAGGWGARDVAYQEALRKDIWQKTTPDVTGVGFKTKWRQKEDGTWEYTAELGEEEQSIYDDAYTRQGMFLDQATALGSGGWEQAQQSRFDQKRALYAGEDAREAAIRRERQYATGASTTGMFAEDARAAENLNQRNMLLEEAAFNESQQLIDSALARGRGDVSMMGDVAGWANQFLKIPTADPKGNLQNVSDAFTRQMDQEAAAAAAKRKGMNKFWGNLLGGATGGGNTGGLSYIATATTQAIGEDGLKVFEDWRDYMFYTLPTFATSFGRYRATAPKIVEEIDKKDNSKTLYKEIWDDYLKPIFNLIKKDKDDPKALSDYKIMVRELKNKYLV